MLLLDCRTRGGGPKKRGRGSYIPNHYNQEEDTKEGGWHISSGFDPIPCVHDIIFCTLPMNDDFCQRISQHKHPSQENNNIGFSRWVYHCSCPVWWLIHATWLLWLPHNLDANRICYTTSYLQQRMHVPTSILLQGCHYHFATLAFGLNKTVYVII